jgi:hypothetical protein
MLPLGQADCSDTDQGGGMELPIVAPAPVVSDHAAVFRDLFENQCQFRHFQHSLTGLIVLLNPSEAPGCQAPDSP